MHSLPMASVSFLRDNLFVGLLNDLYSSNCASSS